MRFASAASCAVALVLAGPAAAAVAGSDSPTPYTVTAAGVTLPGSATFAANGHVNYAVTALDGSDRQRFGTHLDPNNGHPGGAFIGASSYPFTAATEAYPDGYCVVWVQVDGYDEHFGEGGQEPECTDAPPTPATPNEPSVPTAPTPGTDRPGTETPVDVPVEIPAEPVDEDAQPEPTETPAEDSPSPAVDAATPVTNELTAATPSGTTGSEAPAEAAANQGALASTGISTTVAVVAGVLLVAAGAALLVVRRLRRD